ncbi:unnamed protein product [Arabidopsis halleri]
MTKFTFFALFSILILGLMVNKIQGQEELCRMLFPHKDCGTGAHSCAALCLQKWKGRGQCFPSDDSGIIYCLCSFQCRS